MKPMDDLGVVAQMVHSLHVSHRLHPWSKLRGKQTCKEGWQFCSTIGQNTFDNKVHSVLIITLPEGIMVDHMMPKVMEPTMAIKVHGLDEKNYHGEGIFGSHMYL